MSSQIQIRTTTFGSSPGLSCLAKGTLQRYTSIHYTPRSRVSDEKDEYTQAHVLEICSVPSVDLQIALLRSRN